MNCNRYSKEYLKGQGILTEINRQTGVVSFYRMKRDPSRVCRLSVTSSPNRSTGRKYAKLVFEDRDTGKKVCLQVSRLVWLLYRGNIPAGMVIVHKDGNVLNNSAYNLDVKAKPERRRK